MNTMQTNPQDILKTLSLSFEVFPPKKWEDFPGLYETLDELKELHPEFISCTYGAGGSNSKKTAEIASHIENELGIRSIPINILIPVKGTPFGELEPMTQEDILRTVAILRYINPKADVRIAAGRNYFKDGGGELFLSGVNAALTGNLLTTGGSSMEQDRNILEEKGYILKKKPTEK